MEYPTLTIETPYGPMTARLWAGPTACPGKGNLSDHDWPSDAHAFARQLPPAYVGATVETGNYGNDPDLTVNGVRYGASARFDLTADGWAPDRGQYRTLSRPGHFLDDGVTDSARKAWRERIAPAIVAALAAATAETERARANARATLLADIRKRAADLRTEADRLDGMAATLDGAD